MNVDAEEIVDEEILDKENAWKETRDNMSEGQISLIFFISLVLLNLLSFSFISPSLSSFFSRRVERGGGGGGWGKEGGLSLSFPFQNLFLSIGKGVACRSAGLHIHA